MYDRLWDENPKVQQIRTESKAEGRVEGRVEGRAEGRVQGELLTLCRLLVSVVNARFPSLVELAQEAGQIENAGTLDLLVQQVATAPDENTVRRLLSVPRA